MTRAAVAIGVSLLAVAGSLAVPAPATAQTIRQAQWHLDALRINQAHALTRGAGVVVAVVDTGVGSHPDLVGQVLPGTALAGLPGDGRTDTDNHGSRMAGIIAGRGGGPNHVLGIAPGSKILPVRVASDGESQPDADVAAGIRWAADHGARVINVSTAGPTQSPALQDAARHALARDAVVVAGAGNTTQGMSAVGTPASIPGVVAVSGTGRDGDFWRGSVQGKEVALAAPAQDIVTTSPRQRTGFGKSSGTSDATAIVSGAVALIRARFPKLNAANVINRLVKGADDQGPVGRDPKYGFGKLDIVRALNANVPAVTANPLGQPGGSPETTEATLEPYKRHDAGVFEPLRSTKTMGTIVTVVLGLGCLVVVAMAVWGIVGGIRGSRRKRPPAPPGEPPAGVPGPPPGPPPPGWQNGVSGQPQAYRAPRPPEKRRT